MKNEISIPKLNTNIEINTNKNLNNSQSQSNTLIFLFFGGVILAFTSILFYLLFKKPGSKRKFTSEDKTDHEIVNQVLIITGFLFIVFAVVFYLIFQFSKNPMTLSLFNIFKNLKGALFVAVYTAGFIIFLRNFEDNNTLLHKYLNPYTYIVIPFLLLVTLYVFYNGMSTSTLQGNFNINVERIKMMILFLSFITSLITYYSFDPGNYIKTYFGTSSLFMILFSIFSFLYLIILFSLPSSDVSIGKNAYDKGVSNFLQNFSGKTIMGILLFFGFLVTLVIGIQIYPGGFFKNTEVSVPVIILSFLVIISWLLGFIIYFFPEFSSSHNVFLYTNQMNSFKKVLLVLFGLVVSGVFLIWLATTIQNFSGQKSINSLILNLLLLLVIFTLIYKTIFVELPGNANSKKNAFFSLLKDLIFYIPCIFLGGLNKTIELFTQDGKLNTDFISSATLLILAIVILVLYTKVSWFEDNIVLQGGKQLVNMPVFTSDLNSLASYEDLNGTTDEFDYKYGLSFWFYINAEAPNTSQYKSLLNYGNKPKISYNPTTNTLMITVKQDGLTKENHKMYEFDENGNRIIYKRENIELQKWNNIIINYAAGTIDIFYNNTLVKSEMNVVPYMSLDTMTVGDENGINGKICNVVYFKEPLKYINMYYLYYLVKGRNPPTTTNTNKSILSVLK